MEQERGKKLLVILAVVLLALALPVALAVTGGWMMWRESRPEAARAVADGLRPAAERSAEAALPAPTIGAGAIVRECAPENLEKELQRIVRLAGGVGGAASAWNDGEKVRLVAKVPRESEKVFREAVTGGMYGLAMASDGSAAETSVVVEVLVLPVSKAKKTSR